MRGPWGRRKDGDSEALPGPVVALVGHVERWLRVREAVAPFG